MQHSVEGSSQFPHHEGSRGVLEDVLSPAQDVQRWPSQSEWLCRQEPVASGWAVRPTPQIRTCEAPSCRGFHGQLKSVDGFIL